MSRYGINKFMRAVHLDEARLRAYTADPAAFTEAWPDDHLTPAEKEALAARDYGALYAMGAHPFLLWSFAEAVWVPEIPRPDLVERYREASRPHGWPDYST